MKQEIHGPFRYCQTCEYKTRKPNALSMHVSRKHKDDPQHNRHICNLCPKSFPTQTQLGHHLVNQHSDATISCAKKGCTLKFKNTTTQKTHYIRCHMDKSSLYLKKNSDCCKCLSCGDLFTLNSIIYHVSGCSDKSPFHKNKAAQAPAPLAADPELCNLCEESFPTRPQLAHHVVTIHPNAQIICVHATCGLTFKKVSAQKKHFIRAHSEIARFFTKLADKSCKCISCENIFTSNAIASHVAGCSDLSPFHTKTVLLCQPTTNYEDEDMVLNQVDEEIRLNSGFAEDIPQDIWDEIVGVSVTDWDQFEDIPQDINDELNQLYGDI